MAADSDDADLTPFLDELPSQLYPVGKTSWAAVSADIKEQIGKAVSPDGSPAGTLGSLQQRATTMDSAGSSAVGGGRYGAVMDELSGRERGSSPWSAVPSRGPARRNERYASDSASPPSATTNSSTPSSTTPGLAHDPITVNRLRRIPDTRRAER